MAHDGVKNTTLFSALGDLFSDLSDLIQKEVRLARAEVSERIASGVRASVWMGVAGLLALVAFLLLVQAVVFGIASFGIGLHWSSLIVAVVIGLAAGGAYFYGRSQADLTPKRIIRQINQDVSVVREQLT
jgi:hypothetical protein